MSTISLSYVGVQHVVDRCVCRVERYVYVQQSKHMCVCISLLCLLYLCHLCVRSTMSTGAIYTSHVSYTSTHESCLFETTRVVLEDAINIYIIIYVYIYTYIYESCLLYIYIRVMSLTRLHMSHVSYILIWASRPLYIYIWVMSFIHLHTSRVSHTSIYESCPRNGSNPAG